MSAFYRLRLQSQRIASATRRPLALWTILKLLGMLTSLFSFTLLPPLGVALYYGDGGTRIFALSFIITLLLGILLFFPTRSLPTRQSRRDGFIVVVVFWATISLLGAIPFYLGGVPNTFVNSVFEAVSGLTTTGATTIDHIDSLPHAFKYYRAQLHFFGGLGIVVLAVALMPHLGIGGMDIFLAETPGPMKHEKLTPRITETARLLWQVYLSLNIICALAYWLAGMEPFDAICYAFSTMALGGMANHSNSLGHFDNLTFEFLATWFALLAGLNMALYFLAWRTLAIDLLWKGNRTKLPRPWTALKLFLTDPEVQCYAFVMSVLLIISWIYLAINTDFSGAELFIRGGFQSVSIITGLGFTTAGYPNDPWPTFIVLLVLMGSFFAGCAGSTCGGIKAIRFLLLHKQSEQELKILIRPQVQAPVTYHCRAVPGRVIRAVWGFYFLYIFCYCVLSLCLAATGLDLVSAFGSTAAALNNMGVGLGETAGHFGDINDVAKWLLILGMLLGRLEIFPVIILFLPSFWR